MEIQEILETFIVKVINKEKFYSLYGTVKSVNETARTCVVEPIGDEADYDDVRLQATSSSTVGVVLIPTVGSVVAVTFVNDTAGFVSLYTAIDKLLIDTASTVFNGGDNDGLVKINDLVSQMNKTEKDINDLKTALSGWVSVPNDGGAALKTALTSFFGTTLKLTVKKDMEDTKITH